MAKLICANSLSDLDKSKKYIATVEAEYEWGDETTSYYKGTLEIEYYPYNPFVWKCNPTESYSYDVTKLVSHIVEEL